MLSVNCENLSQVTRLWWNYLQITCLCYPIARGHGITFTVDFHQRRKSTRGTVRKTIRLVTYVTTKTADLRTRRKYARASLRNLLGWSEKEHVHNCRLLT